MEQLQVLQKQTKLTSTSYTCHEWSVAPRILDRTADNTNYWDKKHLQHATCKVVSFDK